MEIIMTQEEKKLLLQDLCARLQYGVKGKVYAEVTDGEYDMNGEMIFYDAPFDVILDGINISTEEIHVVAIGNEDTVEFIEMQQTDGASYTIEDFKPYLFPLSSMTEEQWTEYEDMCDSLRGEEFCELIDWFNENHFDYRGLIEKGLAIDATGLNIY
jgi:hypothetical protein